MASGLAEGRRGPSRASRLRRGAILLVVSSVATTVGVGFLQASYSGVGSPGEFTSGLLIEAVGVFGTAVAALVFFYGATRPLPAREASLTSAAKVAVFATLCTSPHAGRRCGVQGKGFDLRRRVRCAAGKVRGRPQPKMSAVMPAYQPMFSAWFCLRNSAGSPVCEMKGSMVAMRPSFGP